MEMRSETKLEKIESELGDQAPCTLSGQSPSRREFGGTVSFFSNSRFHAQI